MVVNQISVPAHLSIDEGIGADQNLLHIIGGDAAGDLDHQFLVEPFLDDLVHVVAVLHVLDGGFVLDQVFHFHVVEENVVFEVESLRVGCVVADGVILLGHKLEVEAVGQGLRVQFLHEGFNDVVVGDGSVLQFEGVAVSVDLVGVVVADDKINGDSFGADQQRCLEVVAVGLVGQGEGVVGGDARV